MSVDQKLKPGGSRAALQPDQLGLQLVAFFAGGTLIRTPTGDRAVERLEPGDLVLTSDNGAQPIRHLHRDLTRADGPAAMVRIEACSFGTHRSLLLPPHQRLLIKDMLAELLFGAAEVLVAAHDLVNDEGVRLQDCGWLERVFLCFAAPQLICAGGLTVEVVQKLALPETDPVPAELIKPARRTLRSDEVRLLLATGLAA